MSSTAYQPFPVTELKTALYNYTKPWIRPQDAFEPLENAFVYRGILQKRGGSYQLGPALPDGTPVMGIMQYINPSDGSQQLVVATQQFLYALNVGANPSLDTYVKITSVSNSPVWSGTVTGTLTVPYFWTSALVGTVTVEIKDANGTGIATTTSDVSDNFPANGVISGGSVNRATGTLTLNITGSTPNCTIYVSCSLNPSTPYFTGDITNFFNFTNWQPTSSSTFTSSTSYLYMTNNKDPVTLYDGSSLARPGFYVSSNHSSYITKALDVKVYDNRLLLIVPALSTSTTPDNQGIFWSALFNPFNFFNDIAGNGGALSAATSNILKTALFLRDDLIVGFKNGSTWSFQRTGIASSPFIFRKLNDSKSIDCPYGGEEYDQRVTNVGDTGLIA